MPFEIRPFARTDLPDLYRICLLTGDAGRDASSLYRDPDLPGHFYAAPYGMLEPENAFLLRDEFGVAGYIVGCRDSRAFQRRMETDWLPPLRVRYPLPEADDRSIDATVIRLLHAGYAPPPEYVRDYPGHLHIDLLPRAQGRGCGRALMRTLLDHLQGEGCAGVHLGVTARNAGACAFYDRLGFTCLASPDWGRWYGLRLGTCRTSSSSFPHQNGGAILGQAGG